MKAILNQLKFLLTGRQQLQSLRQEHEKRFELLQSENHSRVVDVEGLGREVQVLATALKKLENSMKELENPMDDLRKRRLFGEKETRDVLDEVSRTVYRLESRLSELETGSR